MDRYVAVAVCRIAAGKVVLSAEQARSRLHNLAALNAGERGDGVYEIVKPIEFKRGETFGHSEPIPKAMAHLLATPDSAAGRAVIDEVAERTGSGSESGEGGKPRKPRRKRRDRSGMSVDVAGDLADVGSDAKDKPRDELPGVFDVDASSGADDDVGVGEASADGWPR